MKRATNTNPVMGAADVTVLRLALVTIFLLAAGAVTGPAQAADPLQLESLVIDLWPEYDRADLLVILRGQLPADITLPASVTLHIPASSGGPSAVATAQNDALFNVPFTTAPAGEFIAVTLTATTPVFQLEYYQPLGMGNERDFTFSWPGDYAVNAVRVHLQTPPGAENVRVNPDLGSASFDQDGVGHWQTDLDAQAAGQPLEITVSYSRTETLFTADVLSEPSSAPLVEAIDTLPPVAAAARPFPWALVLGGLAGVALLGGGLALWLRRDRRAGAGRGCAHCGAQVQPGDKFCTACGRPVHAGRPPTAGNRPAPAARRVSKKARRSRRREQSNKSTPVWAWVLLVSLGLGAIAVALPGDIFSAPGGVTPPPSEVLAQGQAVYEANCVVCHGPSGEGDVGSPLDGSAHAWHHVDAQLRQFIRDGIVGQGGAQMPAHGDRLSSAEIDAVIGYIKTWWTPEQRAMQRTGQHPMNP